MKPRGKVWPLEVLERTSKAGQGSRRHGPRALHSAAWKVGHPGAGERGGDGIAFPEGGVNCQGGAQGRAGTQSCRQLQNFVEGLYGA